MLGLNISASFNSAVTIYILIPLLIIPQLLLSGVVISFDKFNPRVGKPVGIPFIGEMMTSRWAFEAFMVTQFRDNPFEKQFYDLDKTIASSEYKRIYYIPALETKLSYCFNARPNWNNKNDIKLSNSLSLVRDEISNELKLVGEENFPGVENLVIGKFDSTVYESASKFLTTLKQYYANKSDKATAESEQLIDKMTNGKADLALFEMQRDRFTNKAVTDAVENKHTTDRIVEYDGQLIQRIFPIYMDDHKPKHFFDFRANFYQPTKHFMGETFDTFYFNLCVIWAITTMLFITLYFDILPKIVQASFDRRKYTRKEK
jgi:hypothetical protein